MGKKSVGIKPEKTRLFDDDDPEPDQNFGDTGFRINKDYANRYDSWRQAEETQKLKDKYGNDVVNGVADSDSDSTSSEEAEEWTADDERRFLETLGSLKGGASSIYDSSKKFFGDPSEKPSTSQALSKSKPSKMTLKDYERKVILEKQGKVESDEESGEETRTQQEPAYYKKQQEILSQLKSAIKDDDSSDDNDDLLVKREKSQFEQKQEEDDFYEWLDDRKNDLPDFCNSKESGLKKLKEHWSRQDLDEDEKFLRNYLMNKEFDTDGKETEIPTYEEIVNLEEDEGYLADNSKYEHKYNFRFEEPDQEFIKQFPRTVSESLRQDNSKRKEAREKYKERKKREKEEKIQELKELKKLKKSEIEKRLEKLSKVAGCEIPLSIEELESEYDPEKFDRKMAEIFNKTYYDQEEKLKEDETMEKPVFSDDEDINKSDAEDSEDHDDVEDGHVENSESDGDANDEKPENGSGKKEHEKPEMSSRKRKRQELAALKKKRPLFDPSEKTFDEYLKEYYALDFEDVIGDQTVKFKYRKVTPNDFGLTQEEIVNADDRQLNAWASLKKVTSYRPEEQEKYDVVAYKKRSLDQEKKNRILTMEFGGRKSLLKKEKEKPEQSEQTRNQDGVSKKTAKNRDKRKRKKTNTNADQGQEIQEKNPSQNQSERKNKRRLKKDEKNSSEKGNLNVDDSRLEAYGLNPKKFKQALKYGKKKSQRWADCSMPREEDVIAAVEKYIDYIKNEKKIGHALRRLDDLPMTVEILSGTGVGRIVNRLKDHDEFGDQAATLVEKWKQIAKKSGVMSRKEKRSHMVQAQKEINEEIPEPEPPKIKSPSPPRYEPIRVKQEIITPEKEPPASSKVVEPLKIKKEMATPEKVVIKSEPIDQAYGQEEEERFPNPEVVRKKIKVEREPVEQVYAQDSGERERSPSPQIIKKKIKVKRERDATPPECSSTYQQQKEQKEPKEKKAKVIKINTSPEDSAFGNLLSMADTKAAKSHKKKHKKSKKQLDFSGYLPEIDPAYRPSSQPQAYSGSGISMRLSQIQQQKQDSDDDMANFNEEKMFKPRKDRIRVFAGRKKIQGETFGKQIPTLFSMCIKVLTNNIGAIEETGDIPYEILKPILSKCSPQQLVHIERLNPYLEEDSDELWRIFVEKNYKDHTSHHDETWKEAFFRCKKEEAGEDRFNRLTKKISKNIVKSKESDAAPKMALIADAKAPREVRRRQAKFGTSQLSSKPLPTAHEISKARQKVFENGSTSSLQAIPASVLSRSSTLGSSKREGGPKKPVRGALMKKTLKMLNLKRR